MRFGVELMTWQCLPSDGRRRGSAGFGAHQGGIKILADLFVKAAHRIKIGQMVFEFGLRDFIEGRLRVNGGYEPREALRPALACQQLGAQLC